MCQVCSVVQVVALNSMTSEDLHFERLSAAAVEAGGWQLANSFPGRQPEMLCQRARMANWGTMKVQRKLHDCVHRTDTLCGFVGG